MGDQVLRFGIWPCGGFYVPQPELHWLSRLLRSTSAPEGVPQMHGVSATKTSFHLVSRASLFPDVNICYLLAFYCCVHLRVKKY